MSNDQDQHPESVIPIQAFTGDDPDDSPSRDAIAEWVGAQDREIIANEGVSLPSAYLIIALRALSGVATEMNGEGRGVALACSSALHELFRDVQRTGAGDQSGLFKVE
jgi:hypothetical protein